MLKSATLRTISDSGLIPIKSICLKTNSSVGGQNIIQKCQKITRKYQYHPNTIQKYLSQFKCLWPKYHPVLKGYTQYRYGLVIHASTRGRAQWKETWSITLFCGPNIREISTPSMAFFLYPCFTTFSRICIRYRDHGLSPTQLGYYTVHVSM